MGQCAGGKDAQRKTRRVQDSGFIQGLQAKQNNHPNGPTTHQPSKTSYISHNKSTMNTCFSTVDEKTQFPKEDEIDHGNKSHKDDESLSVIIYSSSIQEIDQLQEMRRTCNTRSKIIKITPKKNTKKNNSSNKKILHMGQFLSDVKLCEIIEGVFTNQDLNSTLCIKNAEVDMEFDLPKCRAGPLIVGSINYDLYCYKTNSKQ